MSILWTRRQQCVDEDVGEDHVDEDLVDKVSTMTCGDVLTMMSLDGDGLSMRCHAKELARSLA